MQGVGSDLIAENACQFLMERNLFTGGVICIDMTNIADMESMYLKLHTVFISQLKVLSKVDIAEAKKNSIRLSPEPTAFFDFLIDLFRQEGETQFKEEEGSKYHSEKKFLLCLTKVDGLYDNPST